MRARTPSLSALTACVSLAVACGGAVPAPPLRGTIVYLVDTLRADHLSCYGYERETSPHLDAFARDALVFERCLSQSTWTKPSTASVLTGLYPAQHGANKETASMPAEVVTLAERLSETGVSTAAFYANSWLNEKHGLGQGFTTYEWVSSAVERRTREVVDRALAFLDGLGDERFFLYLHVVDPHAPYDPPPPYDARFDSGYTGPVDGHYGLGEHRGRLQDLDPDGLQRLVDLYDGEIAYTDSEFGRFLEQLDARGRLEDTLVVFTSDHGEEFREHGGWRHNARLFDEVVRVPLVVRAPPVLTAPGPRRVDALALQIDVAPTVLAAFGLPLPDELPGRDLLALARDASDAPFFGLTEVDSGGTYRKGVVGAGKKYVRAWAPTQEEFLYDLERDPGETRDLLVADPALADAHRAVLERFLASTDRGWFVLFQNGGRELIKAEVLLFADVGHPRVTSLYTEEMAGKGELRDRMPEQAELEWRGRLRKGTRVLLNVEPGDGDGLRFEPAEGEARLEVVVRVGGEPVAASRVLLGADGRAAEDLPLTLELDQRRAALAAPMFPAREDLGGEPFRVRIWSSGGDSGAELELSADEIEAFRALGYFGEE